MVNHMDTLSDDSPRGPRYDYDDAEAPRPGE